jgi:hypothetical protein
MSAQTIQARLDRAGARTARFAGAACDLLRPTEASDPLSAAYRLHRLNAAFLPEGRPHIPVPDTQPFWQGHFNGADTRPGDILMRLTDNAVWFIASREPGQVTLCVRAPRLVNINRPATATSAGLNVYGGTITATETRLASVWPAFITTQPGSGTGQSGIQGDLGAGTWLILLPLSLPAMLRPGDRITDDQGRIAVIATADRTSQLWRIGATQAST